MFDVSGMAKEEDRDAKERRAKQNEERKGVSALDAIQKLRSNKICID